MFSQELIAATAGRSAATATATALAASPALGAIKTRAAAPSTATPVGDDVQLPPDPLVADFIDAVHRARAVPVRAEVGA